VVASAGAAAVGVLCRGEIVAFREQSPSLNASVTTVVGVAKGGLRASQIGPLCKLSGEVDGAVSVAALVSLRLVPRRDRLL
jgi:hypothetical protein